MNSLDGVFFLPLELLLIGVRADPWLLPMTCRPSGAAHHETTESPAG